MGIRILCAAVGLLALASLASQPLTGQEPKQDPKIEEPKTIPELKVEIPPDAIPGSFRMFLVKDGRFEPLKDAEGKLLKGPTGKDIPSPKNREGKIHCLVCENGLAPMVVAFVRADAERLGADSGVAKLAKGLNAMIPKYRADKLGGFVAFLRHDFLDLPEDQRKSKVVTVKAKRVDGSEFEEKSEQDLEYPDEEKRDTHAGHVKALSEGCNVPYVPFGLAPSKSKSNTAWAVKDTNEVTVVVYYRMRRVGPAFEFEKASDLTDEKVAEILKTVEKAILEQKQ